MMVVLVKIVPDLEQVIHSNHTVAVMVEDGNNEMHVRLAAWYYMYGANNTPTLADLMMYTEIVRTAGPVSANVYNELEFKGDKFVKVEDGDYYSGAYVDWLEQQLGIQ